MIRRNECRRARRCAAPDDRQNRKDRRDIPWCIVALLAFTSIARAQQTIFNVPTADVLEKGKVYVELDAAFRGEGTDDIRPFVSFVPRFVVGAGRNFEAGLNVIGQIHPGEDSITLVPTVKWKLVESKQRGIALFAGTNVYIPVQNRAHRLGAYTYAAVSKTTKSTRFTAVAYLATPNTFAPHASRAGGQFGIEHALNGKVTIAADWITGRHANGYFTPGVIYKPHPRVTTYWSYSIGNGWASSGNHNFLFELGYNF